MAATWCAPGVAGEGQAKVYVNDPSEATVAEPGPQKPRSGKAMAMLWPGGQFLPITLTCVPGGPLVGVSDTDGDGAAAAGVASSISVARTATIELRPAPRRTCFARVRGALHP